VLVFPVKNVRYHAKIAPNRVKIVSSLLLSGFLSIGVLQYQNVKTLDKLLEHQELYETVASDTFGQKLRLRAKVASRS
jgi:hypothetical protein